MPRIFRRRGETVAVPWSASVPMFIAEGVSAAPLTAATGRQRCVAMTNTAQDHRGPDDLEAVHQVAVRVYPFGDSEQPDWAPLPVARPARAPGWRRATKANRRVTTCAMPSARLHSIRPLSVWIWKTDPITRSSGRPSGWAPAAGIGGGCQEAPYQAAR